MNAPSFKESAMKSLDADLAEMVQQAKATAVEAILLQTLRILRGRPFNVEINPASKGHWTDGKNWHETAPGQ